MVLHTCRQPCPALNRPHLSSACLPSRPSFSLRSAASSSSRAASSDLDTGHGGRGTCHVIVVAMARSHVDIMTVVMAQRSGPKRQRRLMPGTAPGRGGTKPSRY